MVLPDQITCSAGSHCPTFKRQIDTHQRGRGKVAERVAGKLFREFREPRVVPYEHHRSKRDQERY